MSAHKSAEIDVNIGHRAVHFDESCNVENTASPTADFPTNTISVINPSHVIRKVSFSDIPVFGGNMCSDNVEPEEDENSHVNANEHLCGEEIDDSGHHIEVVLIDPESDEMPTLPTDVNTNSQVFEVKLGMLKQATIYQVEFLLPDKLKSANLEMLRTMVEFPGRVNVPINIGASFKLLSCDPAPDHAHGHVLIMELSTTKQPRFYEFFTLRCIDDPSDSVFLLIHGLSLARGQGTPLLRSGIHRITENPEFPDSDELSEWPGFVNVDDEDEDDGATSKENAAYANQGDNEGS